MARPQLPPLDLRGLPSTDAYGNRVELPEYDSSGMPTLRGPMPGAAVSQPASMPAQSPTSPAPSGFVERRGLERSAAAMQAPRTAAERIENQPNLFERMQSETDPTKRAKLERQFNALPSDAQSAQRARGGPVAFGSTPSEMARDAFNQPRGTGAPSALPFPEQVMIDYRDSSGRSLRPDAEPRIATDGAELSEIQPAVLMKDADGNQMKMGVDGQWHSVPQSGRAAQMMTSPGAVRGGGSDQIYGTEYGPRLRGTQGAMLRFVEDPMQPGGGVLPVPAEFTDQQTYISNLTDDQRSNIKTMLIEQGGAIGKRLQAIEDAKAGVAGGDPNWRGHRGAGQAGKTLQSEEDSLIFGAMKDPSAIMRDRTSRAREQERMSSAQQKASQVAQERALALEQRRMAQLWNASKAQAEKELANSYRAPTQQEIMERTAELFKENGGRIPGQQQPRQQSGAPDSGRMPMAPGGQAPMQQQAPSTSQEPVAISPDSPVDFQQLPNNKGMVAVIPSMIEGGRDIALPAMNFKGRAVVIVDSPATEDSLPPGTQYVLAGEVATNTAKIQIKEGDIGKASSLSEVAPEEEARIIEESTGKIAKGSERGKAVEKFREEQATYKRLDEESTRIAVERMQQDSRTAGKIVLQGNEVMYNDPEGRVLLQDLQGGRAGIDVKGEFAKQKQLAMQELVATEFPDAEKSPSWVRRFGEQVQMIDRPSMPEGMTPKIRDEVRSRLMREQGKFGDELRAIETERQKLESQSETQRRGGRGIKDTTAQMRELQRREDDLLISAYEAPTAEERKRAEAEYFGKQGTTREMVNAERVLTEAKGVYRAQEMRNGRPHIRINGQSIPAERVTAGKMRGTLPRAETVDQAMMLLRMGTPFVTYRNGRAVPAAGLRDDPRIKTALSMPNKRIGAQAGGANANPGFMALGNFVIEKFGYLGEQKARAITFALARQLGYELTGDVE